MKPKFMRDSVDSVRIIHRELIYTLSSGTATTFVVQADFSVNPGLSNLFPWLSTQAVGWEKYKFRRIRFCAYPFCGTSTAGSQMIIPDYNPSDQYPISEIDAMTYYGTVESVPWEFLCCELDTQRLKEPKFIRFTGLGAGPPYLTVQNYDIAQVYFASTSGTGSNVGWSKLWVEYDVELINPQLPIGGPSSTLYIAPSTTGLSATNIFNGSQPLAVQALQGALQPAPATVNGNNMSFNGLIPGIIYQVTMEVVGTVITALSATFSGATIVGGIASAINAAATGGVLTYLIQCNAANVFGGITMAVNCAATTISIVEAYMSTLQTGLVPGPFGGTTSVKAVAATIDL
jgi:hypothetical protein